MKKKQKEEFKLKSSTGLQNLIKEAEDLIFRLRLEKSQNKLKNLRSIFNERKKIALMWTFLNQNKIQEKIAKKEKKNEK